MSVQADNRVYVYEVTGLRQNDQTDNNSYPLRNSGVTQFKVPHNRLNSEVRRISRLGGKIVNVYPINQTPTSSDSEA